jgi:hypothetical protein
MSPLVHGLATLSQILASGIVITAFSLLLYALTFNLRDRVARAFAALLAFVTVVYFCDVLISTLDDLAAMELWLRLQWIGIAFVPVAYLHFTDALLATTGQPSRGRRRMSIRVLYLTGIAFCLAALATDILVRDAVIEPESDAAHLRPGPLFAVFIVYLVGSLAWAAWNFIRAYRRCQTSTSRRRMLYLMSSAAAPVLGTFPFLLVAGQTAALHPLLFWIVVIGMNAGVTFLLVLMAYSVATFGVAQPDRIIKARLFQWILRGPVVVSTVLSVYVLVSRYGPRLAFYDPRFLPFLLVASLLLIQFIINLVRLPIERALFYGADRRELHRLQTLEERLLTTRDLSQFLESVLAGLCDALRSPSAFIIALGEDGKIESEAAVGAAGAPSTLRERGALPPVDLLHPASIEITHLDGPSQANGSADPSLFFPGGLFVWGDYWIVPLRSSPTGESLGLLGVQTPTQLTELTADEAETLSLLAARASDALEDRRLQQDVFQALDRLLPGIDTVQRLRASAVYAGPKTLTAREKALQDNDVPQMVKDALSHYWGGPKLTNSPLLQLRVVQRALEEHDGNAVNALRAVLREGLERIKPEGQRKFTGEWVLYNILELKFLQGRRVRDVAMQLAVSEADLYRKQRLALEELAAKILEMEREAGGEASPAAVSTDGRAR